jgi:hypothetical protein
VTAAPVVLAATPLTGHVRPVLNLARHLVAAGRQVTIVGGSRFAPAQLALRDMVAARNGRSSSSDCRSLIEGTS